jgi:DNA polymerase-1
MLLQVIATQRPTHLYVAWDAGKETFRHAFYAQYKAGRSPTPPELSVQFPMMKSLLEAMNVVQFECAGYEADDILGTIAKQAMHAKVPTVIVTGDKDMLQLVSPKVHVLLTRKGVSQLDTHTMDTIQQTYALTPAQLIDLKGLMGDTSDHIPGVPSIGPKTAIKLLVEHHSLENVLAHAPSITGKIGSKLLEHAEQARMSKQLATIFCDVPLTIDWQQTYTGMDYDAVTQHFIALGFRSLLEKLPPLEGEQQQQQQEQQAISTTVIMRDELSDWIQHVLPKMCVVHIEAIGENPHHATFLGIAFCPRVREKDSQGDTFFIDKQTLYCVEATAIRQWLADEEVPKTVCDVHYDTLVLHWHGLEIRGVVADVVLSTYVLHPIASSYALHALATQYATLTLTADERIYGKGAKAHIPPLSIYANHSGQKAYTIAVLAPILWESLQENDLLFLYETVELPLSTVLVQMEIHGIQVDSSVLRQYGVALLEQLQHMTTNIHACAGKTFNINSPKQMGEVLFEHLKLPPVKSNTQGYSTDIDVLEKLRLHHPIVPMFIAYRAIAKLYSTYAEGLQKEVHPTTQRIHTYFRQTIAATGRLSSQFPNLQNIPIRTAEGREIRKCFVPSKPGWVLMAADYSQIELRVLAHLSKDARMIAAFLADEDIHTQTAMSVFGVSREAVDEAMRRQAKAVNFGIVYGMSDYGLSQSVNITRKQATAFIEKYFAVYRGVKQYMKNIVEQARKDGYVTTILQRRRSVLDLQATNHHVRALAERIAMNTPIQGSAADIIKVAMLHVQAQMNEAKLDSVMLLQVHDELVFEVPPHEVDTMTALVTQAMEQVMPLDVPLRVDVKTGVSWAHTK